MTQVLRAGRASHAGVGYRVHHGPGVLVHYSTAPAAGAPDSSRSFCLSREKLSMQQLNRRLASYLQQVQSLEVANQRLECHIQEELDRKCPRELRQLDGHLKAVSLLQGQISDCLSAQAEVKLQLLGAELTVFDFSSRCDKESERRGSVEAELSDMRLLQEGLLLHTLPELHELWRDLTQRLTELQRQHQQDTRGLLAQASGGVAVEMKTAGSSDLIQQLEHLRRVGETLLHQKQCYNTQVSLLSSPAVTFDPRAGSEVIQAEVEELWRTAGGLEEELTQLQDLNMVLEASSLQQTESFVLQLVDLQQKADVLCRDLDSELQFAAQQAEEHQVLLEVNSRLETQIEDYRRLLDASSIQGLSGPQSIFAANVTSFCAETSPPAYKRNITPINTFSIRGGNLRMMGVQTVFRGHTHNVIQQQSKNSPISSINTSNLIGSFHKAEYQGTGALPKRTKSECMTVSPTVDRKGSPVEQKVHTKHCELQNSSIVSTEISQVLEEGAGGKASKPKISTAQKHTTLAKPEDITSKQITTGTGLQADQTTTHVETEVPKNIYCVEPEVKQEQHLASTDPNKGTDAEVKKEPESAKVMSLSLEIQAEAEENAGKVSDTALFASGSHILPSEEDQGKVSCEVADITASKLEINTPQGNTTLVIDTHSAKSAAVQENTKPFTNKHTTAVGLQADKTGTHVQTKVPKKHYLRRTRSKAKTTFKNNRSQQRDHCRCKERTRIYDLGSQRLH